MSSSIRCPNCRHTIALRGVKPGKFQPKCPKCKEPFVLIIPEDPGASPRATVMPENMKINAEELDLETLPPPPVEEPVAAAVGAEDGMGATAMQSDIGDIDATVPPSYTPDLPDDPEMTTPPPSHRRSVHTRRDDEETAVPVGLPEHMAAELSKPSPYAVSKDSGGFFGKLGGYQVLKKLGQGGMGAVYLAKQTSLDRNVALKVLSPQLSEDPHFVSRFTREAYAAAQLNHHNVVQIHDIGVEHQEDKDTNFFSMEFVEGKTLARMVQETGKLDPEAAVGYILQAARGLKFAHDHGLIHRDVKPDNIMLNDQGVVKVADLGLVKRTGIADTLPANTKTDKNRKVSADQTQTSVAMGTPAYMPPEQARDAATVDVRADIYSLGCTLYDLLTGRPPFVGRTAAELITKHAKDQIVPPDRLDKHIPGELSQIVMKMLARKPEQRYATMGDVIMELEGWLGVESSKPFSPREEHVKVLEAAADQFNRSKLSGMRRTTIRGFFAISALAVVFGIFMINRWGSPVFPLAMIGYIVATTAVYQLLYGLFRHTYLLQKVRLLVQSSRFSDWITYIIVAALLVALTAVFHVLWIWLILAVAAFGSALAFYCMIDIPLAAEREVALSRSEKMLKEMRLRGLDENSLRQFVCKYCGRNWEEFYEALFGYEAKMQARAAWGRGERARNRPKYAAWRDPLISWIDRTLQTHQDERQQKMLAKLESKALQADGMDEVDANRKARRNAERLVQKAAAVREAAFMHAAETAFPGGGHRTAHTNADFSTNWMHDDSPPPRGHSRRHHSQSYLVRRYGSPMDILTGRMIRFIIATILLVGFGTWWNNNGGAEVQNTVYKMSASRQDEAISVAKNTITRAIQTQRDYEISGPGHIPLRIYPIPDWLCDGIGSWNGGLAGALMLLSLFFAGRILGLTMFIAGAVTMFSHTLGLPLLDGHAAFAAAGGIILWLLGVIFFRTPGE